MKIIPDLEEHKGFGNNVNLMFKGHSRYVMDPMSETIGCIFRVSLWILEVA